LGGQIDGFGTLHLRGECRADTEGQLASVTYIYCNIDLGPQSRTIDNTNGCYLHFEGSVAGDTGAGLNLVGGTVYLDWRSGRRCSERVPLGDAVRPASKDGLLSS